MKIKMTDLRMQIKGRKLIFIMNFSILDFFKFTSRMPQISQILVSTFKIFQGSPHPPPPSPAPSFLTYSWGRQKKKIGCGTFVSNNFKLLSPFCSAYEGNANNDLDLGDEVEYTLARKSSKLSAENIRKLSKGTVGPGEVGSSGACLCAYSVCQGMFVCSM